MTEPELRLALSLALAEVERLRGAQVAPNPVEEKLLVEAVQSHVMLLTGASHLAKRAPLVAQQLRHRADRLQAAMPARRRA